VARFDPATGKQLAHVEPDDGVGPIGVGGGSVWAAYTLSDSVTRIDARRAKVTATIPLAQSDKPLPKIGTSRRGDVDPSGVAFGFGSVWVAAYGIDAVIRIDPDSKAILATIPVGDGPTSIAVGGGAVWVANRLGRSVSRVDPSLNAVTATARLGFRAESVAVADGRVLAVVQGR
jgi:virginiamycin B lyase